MRKSDPVLSREGLAGCFTSCLLPVVPTQNSMGSNHSMGSSLPSRVGKSPFLVSNKQVHSNIHYAASESEDKGEVRDVGQD